MKFKLAPVAKSDLFEITDYYTGISADLAGRFASELTAALHDLCLHPDIGSRRYAHFLPGQSLRVWQLEHFPFLLFYRTDGAWLNVLRILHERRDLSADLINEPGNLRR